MDWRLGGGVLRQGCVECFVLSHKNKREGDKENWTAEEGDEQVQKLELENGQEMKTNGPVVCVEDLRLAEATMEGKRSERAAGRGRRVRGRGGRSKSRRERVPVPGTTWERRAGVLVGDSRSVARG